MEELARLYAMLANRGELRPLAYRADDAPDAGAALRLLSRGSRLRHPRHAGANPRPDSGAPAHAPGRPGRPAPRGAFAMPGRPACSADYVLVVWVGNFDGSGNPAFVGVKAAAPLFFGIVDSLRSQQLDPPAPPRLAPRGLSRVEVCAASGDLPNEYCPERVSTWFLPGKSPIRQSTLHRAVLIDTRSGQAVCAANEFTRREIHEFWPSDMLRLFRSAGMPRREPPRAPDCDGMTMAGEADAPQIVSPLRGVAYTVRLSKPAPLALRAEGTRHSDVFWFANQGFVARASAGEAVAWNPAQPGRYVLRAVRRDGRGRRAHGGCRIRAVTGEDPAHAVTRRGGGVRSASPVTVS